jgi:signal recognition particle subunit SRP54
LNFDGVILTKLDGDTAVERHLDKTIAKQTVCWYWRKWMQLMCSIPFVWPKELGMGDVVSLVEREQFDEEEARKIQRKLLKMNLALMIFFKFSK